MWCDRGATRGMRKRTDSAWAWGILLGVVCCLQTVVQGRTTEFGGYVSGRVVLDPLDSPFEVRKEIVIESDSRLVIKPGVEMRFAPGVGITVQRDGVLEATGEEVRRIRLTRLVASVSADEEGRPPTPEVRLVDGDSVLEGRLQLFYRGKWRSVCTNSKNWTSESLEVMCRQLGFSGGRLHQWYPRSNDSSQLMYEDPRCRGEETSLFDCPNWRDRQLGSGVCDFHADLGVHCDNYLGIQKSSNWRGINFFNGKAKDREPIQNKVKRHYSLSSLQYVDIFFAGRDPYGKAVPALEVHGQPPLMKDLNIKYSAFDAISLYKPVDKFVLEDSALIGNRGHGIFINSSVSQATINGVKIGNNGGNGIHYTHHDSYGTAAAFCNTGTIGDDQIYPVRRSHVQRKDQFYVQNCSQIFEVATWTGQVLTVNFMGFSSDFSNSRFASLIEVYDGGTESSRLLASVPIMNNTFPESITSTRQKILLKFVPRGGHDASFMVEILASQGRAYDLNVTNCNITNNLGKGIAVHELKAGVLVSTSDLLENGYAAGLHVVTGCGDIMVNSSLIANNNGDGINVTFAGGYVHVDRSSISSNEGRGISFWFNETSNHIAFNHTVHITRSELVNNSLYGIQMGNQCLADSLWNISMSAFRGNRDSGILISPCWTSSKASQSNIFVTHNQFLDSDYFAIEAFPVLHLHMLIEHNEFRGHERGVLYVGGLDDDDFLLVPAKVEIQHNFFAYNNGKFVANIGVAKGKSIQELLFYKNELEKNTVKELFHGLNPRSRVCAVVAVSSQNTHVYRNRFENPDSLYQLGSHIEKHEVVINSTYNYWGSTKVREIYEKIFDRKDRYNLARVEFLPFLTISSDLDTIAAVLDEHERDKIIPFRVGNDIGGEVPGSVFLPRNTYTVKRDIYVRPGNGKLHIEPGTVLKFDRSVGMMVQGSLISESDLEASPITYTINNPIVDSMQGSSNIRLSRNTEGLLEVNIKGVWGSVCDYGWDILDASIACNQLGLALHPDEWLLEQSELDNSRRDVILSNVQCTLQDTDITLCKAERDFEAVCDSQVGLRCYKPSWAGLRLGMAASESRLKNIVVEFAGLFDYATNSFKPALQIDFNRHHLEKLIIRNNTDSGLGIMWNEVFVSESRQLTDSHFLTNHRHGLVVHTQGLNIYRCQMSNNEGSGIHYKPMFTKVEQRDLISWINLEEQNKVINVPDDIQGNIFLNNDEYRYLVFTKSSGIKEFSITTTSGRSIGVVVLNSFKETSSENMVIYGRLEKSKDVPQWDIRSNLTAFPLRTPGYGALFEYKSGPTPNGQAIIYIASVDGQRSKPLWETHPKIHINSVSIKSCGRGISSYHFNRDISDQGDHFHRYSNETILITNSDISLSKSEAVFVWAPFWDPYIKNLAEINYTLINCTIRENRKSLLHYSRDIRNSNNLFHWTINYTVFEFNEEGGVDIRLPYVWQYSENFTHSFAMHDCSLRNNRKFEFSISGHFARVNVTRCLFQNNFCKKGILSFSGMEKELLIESNIIKANSAFFGVEFNLQSHADQFGLVSASFRKNFVTANRDIGDNQKFGYQPTSYAIGVRGVQLINITRNILENPNLQFELLTGVLTGSIDNTINVGSNWWNSTEPFEIQKRIFDFDDWNGYAIADFSPYLAEPNIDGRVIPFDNKEQAILRDDHLGGRLYEDYRLSYKSDPYVVSSDLTVMPGATLFIAPGVVVEFYPSVGILVLGDLIAEGTQANPITMRPARITNDGRFRRQSENPVSRLCVDEKCDDTSRSDGFLEIYNSTTQQWVPICDARFTERNAQVVCRDLKLSTLNVHMYFGPRLDMGPTQTSHIRSWPHPLECLGTESSLEDCEYRLNGYIENYKCPFDGDFVYVYCGPDALPDNEDHWGGIRFSIPDFETTVSPFNSPTLDYSTTHSSRLEYVLIQGAGILHNEKSSAVQLVQREVTMNFVSISESASHGVEVIGVSGNLAFNEMVVKNNLGVGMNFLSIEGDSADGLHVGYTPLTEVDMSYSVFGMVDMCDINKEMEIENRILLYYKYNNQPVDCVKIFSSRHYGKQIGFRLLQFNLFDGAKYAAQPDSIQIFDGDVFNITSPHLTTITWGNAENSSKVFYKSSETTLSVILHTIGGSEYNGFIAEVVTLPIFKASVSDSQHNISYSELSNNGKGGIAYRSAGEITPDITLRYNRVDNNGKELFGNFTVGESAVLLDVQNSKALYFYNNLIMKNQGGLHLRVDSYTSVSAIKGMIVNNLFTENKNREALVLEGGKSGSFQYITVMRNYFARNYAQYRDTMVISQVKANFSDNVASNNTGKHLLDVYGFENQPLSFQMCVKNWFWKNIATDYWDKSTIIASKAGQTFKNNYLLNPDNDFELATKNRPIYYYSSRVNPVNARMNWWGFNGTAAVSGRIKDYYDYEELLEVDFQPFLHDNTSVLSGKCAGGWKEIGDTCFLYVGGVMTYAEAKKFCEMDNASMPYVKTKHDELMAFVRERQLYYQHYSDRFWIQSLDISPRECAVLVNRRVVRHSCEEYFPFLCERDPEITVSASLLFMEPVTIAFLSVAVLSLIFIAMCIGFWLCKSRQRYKEKLERRNSIRASIRSNRSLTGFSELGYKRRMERAFDTESSAKAPELKMNGSLDSVEKSASRFSCSLDDSYENTVGDTSSSRVPNGDFSGFGGFHPDAQHENRTANLMVHPTFDLTYENQCFVDRSVSRNSHEVSRDWSSSTGSTLDMKRALERETKEQTPYHVGPYRQSPSPNLTLESNDGSSRSSSRQPPLETAM